MRREFPILEFDESRRPLIDPRKLIERRDVPRHCVLTFSNATIAELIEKHGAREVASTGSCLCRHPLYEIDFQGRRLAFAHPGVGASYAAAMLEEFSAMGCQTFIAAGSCGVLAKDMPVGRVIVVDAAVRDEGTSYHYLPPSREVAAQRGPVAAIERVLHRRGVPYVLGKTWTTDAFYRETPDRISLRRAEACIAVDMEASAFIAVADHRGLSFGQMLYAGDDCSGVEWDGRSFHSRREIQRELFWLAAEACLDIEEKG